MFSRLAVFWVEFYWSSWFWSVTHCLSFLETFLLFGWLLLCEITLSADWLIWLLTSNQLDFLGVDGSQSEGCFFGAVDANSRQLDDFFSNRKKVDDISKCFSLEGSVKSGNDDNFALIGKFFGEFNNLREELTFINGNDFVFSGLFDDVIEARGLDGLFGHS